MSEKLEHALAAQLAKVVRPIDGIAGLSDYETACELRRAREVIRQMRWARHSYRWANPEAMEWEHPADPTEDVTMAPEDWK